MCSSDLKPDITIVLLASTKNRIKRLKKRNESDSDLFNEDMYIDYTEKILSFLNECNMNYVTIDTNEKDIDSVVQECIKTINDLEA